MSVPLVSIITPTKGRPEALELCKHYVQRQDYAGEIQHIIQEGGTLTENLLKAMPKVEGHIVFIFEDDDHYSPEWVRAGVEKLHDVDIIGQWRTRYYHLPTGGWRELTDKKRLTTCETQHVSALSCTAFWTIHAYTLEQRCRTGNQKFVDRDVWQCVVSIVKSHLFDTNYVHGMKGLPGTPNMGSGGSPGFYHEHDDERSSKLREWVGDADAEVYLGMMVKG